MNSLPFILWGCLVVLVCPGHTKDMKSPHPFFITGSWFKDRFSSQEWNNTLGEFADVGGNTILLRAPAIRLRGKEDIINDPDFFWCRQDSAGDPTYRGQHCVTQAEEEMVKIGANIQAWATFQYEEDYGDKIMMCPFDEKINSSRIYYRLIFPLTTVAQQSCDIGNSTNVVVLFTTFAGVDSHRLLLETASHTNQSVVFGLPGTPIQDGALATPFMSMYYDFVFRVLQEHQSRYSRPSATNGALLYDIIVGYTAREETCLSLLSSKNSTEINVYRNQASLVHHFKKKLIVSPHVSLNKEWGCNSTLGAHVSGFQALAMVGADVISVKDGRGSGSGAFYWETQVNSSIASVDPVLLRILQYQQPKLSSNVTYQQVFTASIQQCFSTLGQTRDNMVKQGVKVDFWLDVEAFEYLRDAPCLPVDSRSSGQPNMVDRTSKNRLDWAITAAGANVQKIVSFAWDPSYTCTAEGYNHSLAEQVYSDNQRPIISYCGWHSPQNLSVVVLGYNLGGLTQAFQVRYQTDDNKWHTEQPHGYYFETDYGSAHDRLDSLIYIMLYDLWNIFHLKRPHGHVTVKAIGSYHECVFTY